VVNTHKSMLIQTFNMIGYDELNNCVLISKFMKGVFHNRPPMPKYSAIWDVKPVLKLLASLYPLQDLPLDRLTLKLTALLALTTAQRGQALVAIDLRFMERKLNEVKFTIPELMKTSKPGCPHYTVMLYSFAEEKLCVVHTLDEYLVRTHDIRIGHKLLISAKTKRAVSTSTVARWMRTVMAESGVGPEFGAHSVRSAATSAARSAGVSLKDIMQTANWSSAKTFHKYYYRESTGSRTQFSDTIVNIGISSD
jgi:hypothetical protein